MKKHLKKYIQSLEKIDKIAYIILGIMLLFIGFTRCSPIIEENVDVVCIEIYEPVCAGGETFSNSCYAEKVGYSNDRITLGKCDG
jgi:hypothetical protein